MLPQATLMVVFNQNNQVLLLKRSPDHKLFPNEWCLPGGKRDKHPIKLQELRSYNYNENSNTFKWHYEHLPYGETPEECIYRECKEEIGLKIYNFVNSGVTMMDDHYHMHVFQALRRYESPGPERVFPNREHVAWRFFHLNELPEELGRCTAEFLTDNYLR